MSFPPRNRLAVQSAVYEAAEAAQQHGLIDAAERPSYRLRR